MKENMKMTPSSGGKNYVLLALGSNMGNRVENIKSAVHYLVDTGILSSPVVSSVYESEPVGVKEQPWFLNAAISGETTLPPNILIQACKSLEYLMGRVVRQRWHEREIDIDILLYGSDVVNCSKLTVPHPRMHERKFVLVPAAEIAGPAVHPCLHKSVDELLATCKDDSIVKSFHSLPKST